MAFAATCYYQKIKNKVKTAMFRQHCIAFFPMQCCLEPQGKKCIGFLSAQCCSRSIKTILYRTFFLRNVVWSFSNSIAQCFDQCNVALGILKQNRTAKDDIALANKIIYEKILCNDVVILLGQLYVMISL